MGIASRRVTELLTVGVLVALGACGGDDADDSVSPSSVATSAGAVSAPATVSPETPPTAAAATQHFADDLEPVCRGTGAAWASPYDPASSGPHQVVLLEGESESDLRDASVWLNQEWQVMFDAASDAYAETSLVVCSIQTGAEMTETCDGYTDSDDPSFAGTVDVYVATYAVTVRAATTAEVIAETTLDAPESECPMFATFEEGDPSSEEYLADYDALNQFLTEFATT